jgi:hypothetical protein
MISLVALVGPVLAGVSAYRHTGSALDAVAVAFVVFSLMPYPPRRT